LIDSSICNSNILTTFILTKVVPNICRRLPDSVAIVLGKAVLWTVFSSVANSFVSADYCERLKADLMDTGIVVPPGRNPVVKMPILVSGDQGTVFMDEIPLVGEEGGQQPQEHELSMRILENNRTGSDQIRNHMLHLQSGILSLRRENIELRNDIASLKLALEQGFATVNGNVKRVAIQPACRAATGTGIDILAGAATNRAATDTRAALAMMNPPTLMPNPKSLFDLWDEYLNGIGEKACKAVLGNRARARQV
jgi:hypothetical protein